MPEPGGPMGSQAQRSYDSQVASTLIDSQPSGDWGRSEDEEEGQAGGQLVGDATSGLLL